VCKVTTFKKESAILAVKFCSSLALIIIDEALTSGAFCIL
jgi:hypothetical protein